MDQKIAEPLDVTWGMATKVWWCIVWRVTLFCVPAVGVVSGMAVGIYGNGPLAGPIAGVLSLWVLIPISIAAVRTALRKEFGDFSIRLVRIPSRSAT